MFLKRIYSDSSLTSLFATINEEVDFKGIAIRISGTAGAAAPTVADVGRVQYVKRGVTIVDAGFDALLSFGDLIGGTPNREATALGAVDFFCYIPRRYLDDNVEHVVPSDNAQLKITFGAGLAANIAASGLVEVYLDLEKGTQKYDMLIRQYSDSVAGASVRPFAIDQPNILFAGISNTVATVFTLTGSNVTQVSYEIGGIAGDADINALMDNTTFQFNIENLAGTAALVPYALMAAVYVANGDITARLYDNLALRVTTSGASAPEYFIVSAMFDEERHAQSVNKQRARMLDIQQRKAQRNDTATVKTLQQISSASSVA